MVLVVVHFLSVNWLLHCNDVSIIQQLQFDFSTFWLWLWLLHQRAINHFYVACIKWLKRILSIHINTVSLFMYACLRISWDFPHRMPTFHTSRESVVVAVVSHKILKHRLWTIHHTHMSRGTIYTIYIHTPFKWLCFVFAINIEIVFLVKTARSCSYAIANFNLATPIAVCSQRSTGAGRERGKSLTTR